MTATTPPYTVPPTAPRPTRRAALALLPGLLAGCTIVDQRTFRAAAAAPGTAELAGAALPPLPVLTVRFDAGGIDRTAVETAVQLALARNAEASFEVVAPIPTGAPGPAQAAALRQAREDTEQVATALAAAGAPRGRITLGVAADPGTPPREVRVYAR